MTAPAPKSPLSSRPILGFLGPLGTGKTEIAINYSLASLAAGRPTCLIDFDVVTPYFRVGNYRDQLAARGLRVLSAPGKLVQFDTPAPSPETSAALHDPHLHTVLDVGGDPEGARLLAAHAPAISARGADLWLVANPFRPDVSARDLAAQRRLIEDIAGLPITGLVANPHLGPLTDPAHLAYGIEALTKTADDLHLPIAFLAAARDAIPHLPPTDLPLLPLTLHLRLPWETPR